MRHVTALRSRGRERVEVELDGVSWRVVPAEAVARAGLFPGAELDRPAARRLGRELRRARAQSVALSALARRRLSSAELDDRLERAGVAPAARAETSATLGRVGLLDDAEFARSRARQLAESGSGDAAVRYDLEARGVSRDAVEAAVAELEPEDARAAEIVARRGPSVATARRLARKGFAEESIDAAVGAAVAREP